jgi:hypothetical protein
MGVEGEKLVALSDAHKEIRRLTNLANDSDRSPEERIAAARKLLRETEHSARSVRLAKRIAKMFMNAEDQSADIRKRAASLFQFVCDQRQTVEDQEPEIAVDRSVVDKIKSSATAGPQTLADLNAGWNAEPIPKKWIAYLEPADLIPYGIPDDAEFAWKTEYRGQICKVTLSDGAIYWVSFPEFVFGFATNRVLNPRYLEAYRTWKTKRFPRGLPDKSSPWFLRNINRTELNMNPELCNLISWEDPLGEELKERQLRNNEVEPWEDPFLQELYIEIMIGHKYGEYESNRTSHDDYPCLTMA